MEKIVREKAFCYIFNTLAIAMFVVLFWYCLRLTGENSGGLGDEYIYFKADSVFLNVIWICLALPCLWLIGKLPERLKSPGIRNMILGLVCVISAMVSFWWICVSKTAPQADQLIICNFANAFNRGDFTGLQKGGYVALYPQQLGMITLLRIIFAIFGADNYMAFKCVSAASVPLLVLSGCKIVRILSNDNIRAELYYMLFVVFCFPMYAYTSFVYGDLLSIAVGMFSVWMFLSCLRRFNWRKLALFGVSMGIAVQIRENLLILAIALGLVSLIKFLFDRCRKNSAIGAALVLGLLLMKLSVNMVYHDVWGGHQPSRHPFLS